MLAKFLAIRPGRTTKRLSSRLVVVIKEVAELAENHLLLIRQMLVNPCHFESRMQDYCSPIHHVVFHQLGIFIKL